MYSEEEMGEKNTLELKGEHHTESVIIQKNQQKETT